MTPSVSASPLMHDRAAPLLHRDAALRLDHDQLVVETPFWEFKIPERGAALAGLLAKANGVDTLADLAAGAGLTLDVAARLLEPLAEEGAVIDAIGAASASDAEAFLDAFQLECRLMMRALSEQPFWRKVLSGQASPELILGWGVEFAYFVEAANEYMPLGVAHARESAAIREAFARHYAEEAGHSVIFYEGLARCGLDSARMTAAPPLATTRALINLLVEHALEGSVTYAAGFAVMQPQAEPLEKSQVRAFYGDLRELYAFATPMFDAFERHACLDLELGHQETVFSTLNALGGVPAGQRGRAVEAARAVCEAFILFFEGILSAYDRSGVEVPRRPVLL